MRSIPLYHGFNFKRAVNSNFYFRRLAIRRSQSDGEAALGDNEALAASFLILIGQLAEFGEPIRISGQSFFISFSLWMYAKGL